MIPNSYWWGCENLTTGNGEYQHTATYRWHGKNPNGFPKVVEAWNPVTEAFEPCPNINVALRIKRLPSFSMSKVGEEAGV